MAKEMSESELNNVSGGCGGDKYYVYLQYLGNANRPIGSYTTSKRNSLDEAKADRDNKTNEAFASNKEIIRSHWRILINNDSHIKDEGDIYRK